MLVVPRHRQPVGPVDPVATQALEQRSARYLVGIEDQDDIVRCGVTQAQQYRVALKRLSLPRRGIDGAQSLKRNQPDLGHCPGEAIAIIAEQERLEVAAKGLRGLDQHKLVDPIPCLVKAMFEQRQFAAEKECVENSHAFLKFP